MKDFEREQERGDIGRNIKMRKQGRGTEGRKNGGKL
jgi:hypothetical protein